MQSVSSRIWTRIAVSISYDDNHYTMGTSGKITVYFQFYPVSLPEFEQFLNLIKKIFIVMCSYTHICVHVCVWEK